jgi:hypothetical protein
MGARDWSRYPPLSTLQSPIKKHCESANILYHPNYYDRFTQYALWIKAFAISFTNDLTGVWDYFIISTKRSKKIESCEREQDPKGFAT